MKTYKTKSHPFTVVISVEFLLSFYTKPSLQVLWQYSPWKTLSLDPSPWMKPIALTLLSLGPGPQGTSPDNCLPGTFTSCALSAPPNSSQPEVPLPCRYWCNSGNITSGAELCFVLTCSAGGEYIWHTLKLWWWGDTLCCTNDWTDAYLTTTT